MTSVLALAACGGTSNVDDTGVATADSGLLPRDAGTGPGGLGQPCEDNTGCMSGLCFQYNMSGKHCSKPCTAANAAAECPMPPFAAGCSGMGVCKLQ